ncbi:MAG: hypothetical protein FJ308_19620 [Planctomycetes bacterium]|nr:hypothetical protein [Planctomycetota bacterium]
MKELFRADKRDFEVGARIFTAGEYYKKFPAETKTLEDGFETHRPEAKPNRRDCLFLFESLDAAKKHWSIMSDGKLYKVEVEDNAILHRGDMNWLDVIADHIRENKRTIDLYGKYWAGEITENACVEVLVASAVVVEVISKDQQVRRSFLAERYKS